MATVNEMLIGEIKELRKDVKSIMVNGCSKAETHRDLQKNQGEIFKRIREVENSQSENRGKLVIISMIIGAVITGCAELLFRWTGENFPF
jgi:hypothetical protein